MHGELVERERWPPGDSAGTTVNDQDIPILGDRGLTYRRRTGHGPGHKPIGNLVNPHEQAVVGGVEEGVGAPPGLRPIEGPDCPQDVERLVKGRMGGGRVGL